ncbi:hypothetical protein J7E38_15605 [Bacillus sp. ISL-35]|uniref:hypothetical protein n=1 Tax=Bacillus sp. ISL-35 TaxID=2819122 RepID=UPI001BE6AF60|nr:hypothetical protein [Bacillus sp. ISL-35]MBT2680436.1 hypothetical protein [Bacillus sp. ISL-35]MBT2704271.1 hypothetical protein [Chryseobacterium sp. ISL-80]
MVAGKCDIFLRTKRCEPLVKRIKYTTKQKKDQSLLYCILSGFMLVGIMVAGIMEGLDRSVVAPLVIMVTSFIMGILYRWGAAREENRETVDQIKRGY